MKLHEGEIVGNGAGVVTTRIAVASGWLYTTAAGVGVAHAFVPDPDADHCQFENIVPAPDGYQWRYRVDAEIWLVRRDDTLNPVGEIERRGDYWVSTTAGDGCSRDTRVAAARWLVANVTDGALV
jgi:hypothetical protein